MQICRFSNLKSFTAKLFLTFAALINTQQMFGQMVDDFSDGDFTSNPTWTGTDSKFIITSGELKLQAPALSDFAYLTTTPGSVAYGNWEFLVRMDFNPSSTNYTRIYLSSDQFNLSDPLNGYFVLLGSALDEISLWKQQGTSSTKLIEGQAGRLDTPSVIARIKVTLDESGLWTLFADVSSSGSYLNEGSAIDTDYAPMAYFGIYCSYTATRSDKFYFDDFNINSNQSPDITPPEINSVEVVSSTELRLTFSESIDQETARVVSSYSLDNSHGAPSSVFIQSDRIIILQFQQAFVNGLSYSLITSGVKDIAGNVITSSPFSFTFVEIIAAAVKDIVITEIFADPTPTVSLPEFEFIEILNRSTNPYNLKGWKISDGTTVSILPETLIHPGEYAVITSTPASFVNYGRVVEISNLPSLNNTGDMVVIKDLNGITIDSVSYTDHWYNDNEKKNGGWTLELIDPENLCGERENWAASEHPDGGTPGQQNSVLSNKPDLTGPFLLSVVPVSPSSIQLTFNEKLNRNLPAVQDFFIEPAIGVSGISFSDVSLTKLNLLLVKDLQQDVAYTVTAKVVYDCAGNLIDTEKNLAHFGLPQVANPRDLLVNEILFNPRPLGNDFVEIVNVSSKYINLKGWSIANIQNELPANAQRITHDDFLFKPGEYLVLTEDIDVLASEYSLIHTEKVLVVENLPSFNDAAGSVTIIDESQHMIDGFSYIEGLHSPFIDDAEGVSLERISFTRPTDDDQNWKSASSTVGFATPGFLNSNAQSDFTIPEESVTVVPEIFIPAIGQPDFAQICYKFAKGGYVANVNIYDPSGHLIKQVANNELLATEGIFRWDGDRNDGNKARVGYYMIWFEIFDETGLVMTFRKRLAVATKF